MKVRLVRSPNPAKKWRALFTDEDGHETHTDFGAKGMEDFTQHRNPLRKANYLRRHQSRENWRDPTSAGALARWILWNKPTLEASLADYRSRFSLG